MSGSIGVPSGHVFRVERKRGPVWYAKYRLPSGRQVQKQLGPAWTERGRPPAGYFTKRTAEAQLRTTLEDVRRGTLQGSVEMGVRSPRPRPSGCGSSPRIVSASRRRWSTTAPR
jgi:hypothetical protein